ASRSKIPMLYSLGRRVLCISGGLEFLLSYRLFCKSVTTPNAAHSGAVYIVRYVLSCEADFSFISRQSRIRFHINAVIMLVPMSHAIFSSPFAQLQRFLCSSR